MVVVVRVMRVAHLLVHAHPQISAVGEHIWWSFGILVAPSEGAGTAQKQNLPAA